MAIDINIPIEDAVTGGSLNPVTSNAVFDGLAGKEASLGFTPENVSNKQTDLTASATKYPTVDAVNTGLSGKVAYENATTFSNISVSTTKRLILVDQDETNSNEPTLYLHDGTNLQWIVSQII